MRTEWMDRPAARRVATLTLTGTTALAIVGGSLVSATAANADTTACTTTTGSTTLVSTNGSAGLVNLGGTGGLVGVTAGSGGVGVGLLNCGVAISLGGQLPGTSTTTVATPATTPTSPTATGTPGTPATTQQGSGSGMGSAGSGTGSGSGGGASTGGTGAGTGSGSGANPPAQSKKLAEVKVSTNARIVYPTRDGYKDNVTFSIKGLNSGSGAVAVTGRAVLKKGTKVVKTWKISSTTKRLSWNGLIGKKVKPGLYKLTVRLTSADGTVKTKTMSVQVSGKHLVQRTATVRSTNLAKSSQAAQPKEVTEAFALGRVTVRVRTVARVLGKARLIYTGENGALRYVDLKNGTHTTESRVIPKGFGGVRIGHDWKKGSAELIALYAIFSYKKLV